MLKKDNIRNFSSEKASLLWHIINSKSLKVKNVVNQVENAMNKFDELFQKFFTLVDELISNVKDKFDQQNKQKVKILKKINQKQQNVMNLLNLQPSVITNLQDYQTLVNFFPEKIQNFKLVFKASQHNFSIKKYYEACGNLQKTIVICSNQNDKIIGGFTPLKFGGQVTSDYLQDSIQDESQTSFIFTVSQNKKFALNDKTIVKQCSNISSAHEQRVSI